MSLRARLPANGREVPPQMKDKAKQRFLFVAIDRAKLLIFVAIKRADSAQAFLKALLKACSSRINKLLTDNCKEFTAKLFSSRKRQRNGNYELDWLYHGLA